MKRLLATTAMLAALAAPAWADDFFANSFSQPSGFQNVTITSPVNLTVRAGEINLHSNGPPAADLLVWCLDLNDLLQVPYDFQINTFVAGDSRPGIPSLNVSQVREIASLMKLGLTVNPDSDSDAAVQVAIWKTEYGAGFNDTGLSLSLQAKIALLLVDASSGGLIDCPTCSLTVLTDAVNAPNQALGFAVIPVPAPVVGAGLPGLLSACVGLWAFAKRRRNRA